MANLRESRGEQAEGLVFVSREGRSVAVEVARDTAAGGTGAVTERLYASLSLKLCNGKREQVLVSVSEKPGVPSDGRSIDKSVYCIIALKLHLFLIHLFWGDLMNHSGGIPAPGPTSLPGSQLS